MSTLLETRIRRNSPDYEQNTRRMVDLLTEIKNEEAQLQEGGGAKAIEGQHKKGRLTARERRISPLKTISRPSTWSIPRASFCPCRRMFFRIPTTSAASFAITR